MPLRIVRPWRLRLPDREAQRDRRQRAALAEEIGKFRRLLPKKRRGPSSAERQLEAFATPVEPRERAVARGFGEAAIEGQFGPFREEDVIRIGARGAARFREELTTDPILGTGERDLGRQPIPAPEAQERAKDVRRIREALDAEGLSTQDFQMALRVATAGDDTTVPVDIGKRYNAVIRRLDVKDAPALPEEPEREPVTDDMDRALLRVLEVNEMTPQEYGALSSEDRVFAINKAKSEPFPGEAQSAFQLLINREQGVEPSLAPLGRAALGAEQFGRELGAAATTGIRIAAEEVLPGEGRPSLEAVREGGLKGAIERSIDVPVAPDVLNPLNLIPIPIFDPLVARALGVTFRVGQRVTRSLLTRLGREAAEQATSETLDRATRIALREFSEEVERAAVLTPGEAAEVRALTGAQPGVASELPTGLPARLEPAPVAPARAAAVPLARQAAGRDDVLAAMNAAEQFQVINVEREFSRFSDDVIREAYERSLVAPEFKVRLKSRLGLEAQRRGLLDVEPGAAPAVRQAAPAPPTVKTRTLFGEEVDTFATERELGGIREQQGGLPLEERPPARELPDLFGRTERDLAEELRIVDEDLARPRLPKGTRGEFQHQRLKLIEEQRILRLVREGDIDVLLEGLEREWEDVAFDLSRKGVPFGGRAGVSVRQAAKQRVRGFGTTIARTGLETPQLQARAAALEDWVPRLREQVGPARPPTREQLVFHEAAPGREVPEAPVTTADVDVRPVGGGARAPALMEGGNPVDLDLWRAVERGKITSERAADLLRDVGERLSNVPGVRRAVKLGAGPQVIGRADPATRAGLVYHTMWTMQDGERLVRMTRLRELTPDHWRAGQNAGEITINDRSVAMGDLGQAWLRGETEKVQAMIGRDLLPEETAWFTEAQDYMRTLAGQWGAQTGNVHLAGETVWPRFVREADGSVRIRRPIGAKQSPLKVRVFETMEEGIRREIPYTDPLQTMDLFGRALQKMTRDDILAKVVIEDDIGRIIEPKGLLDRDVVAATEAARVGYRDASRARRAAETEARVGRPITRAGARPAARGPAVAGAREAERTARRAWLVQRKKYTDALHAAQSRALSGRRGERPGLALGPGLGRVIFSEENLRTLETMLGPSNVAMQSVARVAAIPRLTQAGLLDMAQGSIQMATVFYRRPGNWAKGMASGFREAFQPGAFQRWVAESPVARDAIAHDVQVVGSFEPVEAIVGGGLLERAAQTRAGKVLTAFARAFDASIGTTKAWEYDALARISRKAGEPDDELFRIGSYINTKLGTTNTREMGLSATQRAAESGFGFFSPRYTRSIPGFLAWAMGKGIPARDARESLFLLMLGGAGTFYGLARAKGLSHEETVHRLDPRSRGQFMSIPVFGNEIGFGSAWRSYIKFMGDLAREDSWDFDSWDDAALNNPLTRFLRSRTSPVTGTLMDFLMGEDFIGREVSIAQFIDSPELMIDYAADSILPFSIESIMEARGGLTGMLATFGAEFAGGRAFPQSAFTRFTQAREAEFERRKEAGTEPFASFDSYDDLRVSNRGAADEIDATPAVQATQQGLDEAQERRRETETGRFFGARERVLEEFRGEQAEDDQNLEAFFRSGGEAGLDPQRWGELQRDRLGRSFERREGIRDAFQIEFERETGQAPKGSVNAAVEDYFAVDVEKFTDPVTRDIDPAFYDARDRAFADLSPGDRANALAVIKKNRTPLQREYEGLRREPFEEGVGLDDYYDIPSEDRNGRDGWRRRNPRGDAILFVTGSVTTLVTAAAVREAEKIVRRIFGSQAAMPRDVLRSRGGRGRRTGRERRRGGVTFSGSAPSDTIELRPRRPVESPIAGLGR